MSLPDAVADADRDKWNRKYRRGQHAGGDPPAWLDDVSDHLPTEGAALDVAAGDGRVAVWMASRGLDVTAVDISSEGLALARDRAQRAGVTLRTLAIDLEQAPLPEGPFALITCFFYRQPSLFAAMRDRLAPGGLLLVELPTIENERPSRRFLVEPDELREAAAGLEVLHYDEAWRDDRHTARLLARKPA